MYFRVNISFLSGLLKQRDTGCAGNRTPCLFALEKDWCTAAKVLRCTSLLTDLISKFLYPVVHAAAAHKVGHTDRFEVGIQHVPPVSLAGIESIVFAPVFKDLLC